MQDISLYDNKLIKIKLVSCESQTNFILYLQKATPPSGNFHAIRSF